MDERPTYNPDHESGGGPRRGRRVAVALLAAGVLAAVPAGVALAGSGSDGSAAGNGNSPSSLPVQSTTPEDGQQNRGEGDRGDCPEKKGQGGQEESTQL
jgi:hypothetical protein